MKQTVLAALAAAVVAAAGASAQTLSYKVERQAAGDQGPQGLLDKIKIEQAVVVLESTPILNAPYTAETVNESVQELPDGNRIVKRSTSRVYRDSAGRTRRETLGPDGQVTTVTITHAGGSASFSSTSGGEHDTVIAKTYFVARDGSGQVTAQTGSGALIVGSEPKLRAEGEAKSHITIVGGDTHEGVALKHAREGEDTTKEDLGQQTIEGVTATGTRTTTIIPAGQIGNEQPIRIVSEQWFSPELRVLVLTKHVDPRVGETTYRLTNISRVEPDKALFDLPAGKATKDQDGVSHFELRK